MSRFCGATLHAGSTLFECKLLNFHKGQHRDFGPGWSISWYPEALGAEDDEGRPPPPKEVR